ncbi:hypothetical protein MKW98_031562 [Papaver atlanticum]|uniref:Amidase domain-containing protein n=1 Tax=Papaver atlanticum TaxID=357466 RepID=A0AAD4S645_9MAGN|nr:hypothetical protein MKW98_031562 [Papaver atlanticum]
MDKSLEFGAFTQKFLIRPSPNPSPQTLPLNGLTFAVKEIFDVEGYVTGFGNPDWIRTHSVATSTAPTVLSLLSGGATCVGTTVMDEMAYSINGENIHYGTPINPCARDRVPGGSSSGSAVAVAAELVDFSLGTDTGGSVRVPASYCGILGFRPSHGVVTKDGVVPMAQSFDTVGWFARDPKILNRVGRVLLQLPDVAPVRPSHFVIPDDCFQLLNIPSNRLTETVIGSIKKLFGSHVLQHKNLGEYVEERVPSLEQFMDKSNKHQGYIPSLIALSAAMRSLQRFEFKNNHKDWVTNVKPHLGPGISERVWEAMRSTDENIKLCHLVKSEIHGALTALLEDFGVLVIPTVPGPPPKLLTEGGTLETFRVRAFSLLSIAGVSGFCQVSLPLGKYDNLPVSISLIAKHGADGFLLSLVETLYGTLQEQVEIAEKSG